MRPSSLVAGQPHQRDQRAEDQAAERGERRQRQRERHAVEEQVRKRAADDVEIEIAEHGAHFPDDVAGDRHRALEEAHAGDDDDIDQQIQHGRGGEGLEHLKRKFLHRARLAGQLDQADGDGDRRVLDGVEEFRRQRRQDDAKRHRQQHVAIGLQRRQPERGSGLFLPARQRIDARLQLHGDARRHEQPDPDRRRIERRVGHLLHPQPRGPRQQFRQHEEPEEQLHQQRHVAEEFDVAKADPGRGLRRQRAQHADDRAGDQRDDPGAERGLDRQHQPGQQHVEIGAGPVRGRLEEDVPVPVIVHRDYPYVRAAPSKSACNGRAIAGEGTFHIAL